MRAWAVIFDWFPTVPVYHSFSDRLNERDGHLSTDYTRCGRIVSQWNSDTHHLSQPGQWIPLRHAHKFGRPCRKCFP